MEALAEKTFNFFNVCWTFLLLQLKFQNTIQAIFNFVFFHLDVMFFWVRFVLWKLSAESLK